MRTLLVALAASMVVSAAKADEKTEFFEKKIRPVLVQHCYSCHSTKSKSVKGGLVLDTRSGIRRGGDSGPAVVPKNIDDSLLMEAIRYESLEMPPKEKLPDEVIADFEKWIRMGAPDPRSGGVKIQRKIDYKKAREFWAYQPLKKAIPQVKTESWVRNDIDRFILAGLESKGLAPNSDAAKAVLARRVYFDLIGLPPSPQEIDQFVADESPDALSNLIDDLLNRPHFGEHWGRHWLDVVRYGESTGMERNFTYPHAWRYRDYVIKSFNSDKPFDQFAREQLAGDLLRHRNQDEREEHLVATGMLAMGPKSLNERNREKFAMDIVDEQIDVTSRAFLGLTAACARCHDHKFDAISSKDYYALAGIFRSTTTLYGTGGGNGNRQAGRLIALAPKAAAKAAGSKTAARKATGPKAAGPKATRAKVAAAKKKAPVNKARAKQIANLKKRIATLAAQNKKKPNAKIRKQLQASRRRLRNLENGTAVKNKKRGRQQPAKQTGPLAMGVRESAQIADTQIRIRGEVNDRGEKVARGFLTVISNGPTGITEKESGRRQLAAWIVSSRNPLTARVAANRIWQHLFGQGIVRTVNNFGVNGERPSNPALLDYLALKMIEQKWSVKRMIKFVMMSRAYQMSSEYREAAFKADPENRLVWRMSVRRLTAEAIRDSILWAGGSLDREPRRGSIVATVGDGEAGRNLGSNRFAVTDKKRSVYLPIVRGMVPELLRVFDFPEPSIIFGRRDETTVPTQALYMMNSKFVLEQSLDMAKKVVKASPKEEERLTLAYRVALGRPPTSVEMEEGSALLKEIRSKLESGVDEAVVWSGICHTLFASAEFRFIQ